MDNIKFRAWDSKENKWLFGYELPNLGGFSMFGEVVVLGEWGAAAWKTIYEKEPDRIKLMLYTGCKDKFGKEIYDGDILTDGLFRVVVEWGASGWVCGEQDLWAYIDEDRYWIDSNIYEDGRLAKA